MFKTACERVSNNGILAVMKIEKLSGTLQKIIAARGLAGRLGIYRILGQWEGMVGNVIARHAQPLSIRGKSLSVQVDSPVWMQQLSLLKPELIEKANGVLGEGSLKEIMLVLGDVRSAAKQKERAEPLPPLNDEEQKLVEGVISEVSDPEIKEALRKLMEKDLRSRKKAVRREK